MTLEYTLHFCERFLYTEVKPKQTGLFFSKSDARRLRKVSKGGKFESFKYKKLSKLMFKFLNPAFFTIITTVLLSIKRSHCIRRPSISVYRKIASSRPVYYSILNSIGQRSQYIIIKYPLHKQSKTPWVCF